MWPYFVFLHCFRFDLSSKIEDWFDLFFFIIKPSLVSSVLPNPIKSISVSAESNLVSFIDDCFKETMIYSSVRWNSYLYNGSKIGRNYPSML